MKIEVNQNQQRMNQRTHIYTIITIAKQKAEAGISKFSYPIPRNIGMSAYDLIDEVEIETENSVYGGYKCIQDGIIKFTIR